MSSSPSRSRNPLPAPTSADGTAAFPLPAASPFPYRELPATGGGSFSTLEHLTPTAAQAAESATAEARARDLGRQEGHAAARKSFDEQLAQERSAIAAALEQFTHDRNTYYQQVEAEVVQLALGIARKILHRETQLDPWLLAGVVRVALEKIEGATEIVLAVHPQRAAVWAQYLGTHMDAEKLPEIVEDASLEPDRCRLRTSMGTAELGIEVQLKEIERGFMDLLAARPEAKQPDLKQPGLKQQDVKQEYIEQEYVEPNIEHNEHKNEDMKENKKEEI